jgi:hypothetical protein
VLNFREFEAGPDPFGRKYEVRLKWMLTAISIRHSDSVDVKFVLQDSESREEKTIALMLPDLMAAGKAQGRPMTDPWCCRLAALHLQHMVTTGEDMEKDLVTVLPEQLGGYASQIGREEEAAVAPRK